MRNLIVAAIASLFIANLSFAADSSCEAKAVGKSGKPLTGAAKSAFMKKCEKDAAPAAANSCEAKAIDKNGKPLAGAAKSAFMKKCEKDVAAK